MPMIGQTPLQIGSISGAQLKSNTFKMSLIWEAYISTSLLLNHWWGDNTLAGTTSWK